MEDFSEVQSISTLFDIRVESLAAALLSWSAETSDELSLDQVIVSPQGALKKRSNYEVKSIRKKQYEDESVLFIEVNRKGLFDTLPEGLFLRTEEEYDNPKERARSFDRQKKDARKFFLPFEQALFHPRIQAEQLEQEWTEQFPGFFQQIWDLKSFEDYLDDRQRFLLCYLLPEAHRVAGNWELTGLCFEAVMQKPVDLGFVAPFVYSISETAALTDEYQLGEGGVIGESFRDDMPALEVRVRGITLKELPDYLPEGGKRKVLEELLYSYFLPLDIQPLTRIIATDDAWGFIFGEAVLGYNVLLR